MTITAVRPVTCRPMGEPNILDRAGVGALIGVAANTITIYMRESRPGGRYAEGGEHRPFPAPDGKFGSSPFWLASRADEIRLWATERPRHGIGGRPRSMD